MRKVFVVALALILLGCISIGKPEIKRITYGWGKVNSTTTEILVNVEVYNPNPFPIPLKDVVLRLYMNGIEMGEGHAIKASIPAHSTSPVVIAIYLDNDKIPEWWVSHIKNGEKTVIRIDGYLVFKIFDFKYPISFTKTVQTDILSFATNKPVTVSVDGLSVVVESLRSHWGKVTNRTTEIVSVAEVHNPNPIPIPVLGFDYTIKMNGIVVGSGSETMNVIIPPKGNAKLEFVTKIDNEKLKDWWVSHIKNGERTKVEVVISPKVKIAGRVLEFPIAKQTFYIKTSFLI